MRKIKTGDNVIVMRGKDAGVSGEVLHVSSMKNKRGREVTRVVVKGVNIVKKHQKPNPTLRIPGGVVQVEKAIDISNVMLIDPKDGKPTRVGFKVDEKTGNKVRVSKRSGTVI